MRVFLAGASGVVGRPLLRQLRAAGHDVVALTRSEQKAAALRESGATAVVGDVFERGSLATLVGDAKPDAVIHQLTDLPPSMEPRHLQEIYARNNRVRGEGTDSLLEAATAAGARRFIVQSMGTWYRPEGGWIKDEAAPLWLDAPEPLGDAVRTVARMEAEVQRRVPIAVVLRYGAFYGPGTWYAPDGEIARRMQSRGFPIVGDGQAVTSFIHVEDAAAAAVAALSAPASRVYNVTDDDPAPAAEWISWYAGALGAPRPMKVPVFLARLAIGNAVTEWLTTMRGASNQAIRHDLAWRPQVASWRDGFVSELGRR